MEVLNDLVGYKNRKIYQNSDWFNFSLDSVLLANFVTINKNINHIIDLCSGNCPIPLILSTKTECKITAIEIQKDICDLANKRINYNNLEKQITVDNIDINNMKDKYQANSIDVITCNPPYFKYSENSNLNDDEHKIIARHEKMIKLEDIIIMAKYLLKTNGCLAMVHRTDRIIEIINLFNKHGIEIKKMRFIYPKSNSESNLVLIEGNKNGGVGLKLLPPLIAHNEDGSYSDEVLKYFE